MTTTTTRFEVHHDGVTIPVSRGGRGRPLILCPGLSSSQADLHELIVLLRRDHDVLTFDLRGHGLSSAAERYTFDAFLGDLIAVMADLPRLELLSPPVLVGYSLGADLAVHYAAEHPDSVAELVLIDGANPVPEPFLTEADLPEFRAMWESLAVWNEAAEGTVRQVLLGAQQILDLNIEVDAVRSRILDRYREIDCPISMIMSAAMASGGGDERAEWRDRNWRAGIERLVREHPHIVTTWVDADHRLVSTHAPEVARIIRSVKHPVIQHVSLTDRSSGRPA
ncbi:alpha/beta fold hydrolase [Nocardia sp. NPDC088792]|uniref:alpha/beta fold hydrolase n=1 Tax=Nocardia sp. NPDC088792 TaxID=3364332 RepID=UPI0038251723